MDILAFGGNTYSGTYAPGNNGAPSIFTVAPGGANAPAVGDNLTLATINGRHVYIQDSGNNGQYIVTSS